MTVDVTAVLALLVTIVVEFAVLWLLTRRKPFPLLLYVTLINAFTEPLASYAYQSILPNFWLVEATVVLVESVLLAALLRVSYPRALVLSLLANLASAALSPLL